MEIEIMHRDYERSISPKALRVLNALVRAENPKFRAMWARIFLDLVRS